MTSTPPLSPRPPALCPAPLRYADDDDSEAPGKTDALFQLTDFFTWLDEPPLEESDEEEEEEVIDINDRIALK